MNFFDNNANFWVMDDFCKIKWTLKIFNFEFYIIFLQFLLVCNILSEMLKVNFFIKLIMFELLENFENLNITWNFEFSINF